MHIDFDEVTTNQSYADAWLHKVGIVKETERKIVIKATWASDDSPRTNNLIEEAHNRTQWLQAAIEKDTEKIAEAHAKIKELEEARTTKIVDKNSWDHVVTEYAK